MRHYRKCRALAMVVTVGLALTACDDRRQQAESEKSLRHASTPASTKQRGPGYGPLTLAYTYDGKLGFYDVADAATAYIGSTIVAKGYAKELREVGGATHIEVEEVHFDKATGAETYRGTLLFSIAVDGRPVSETRQSGEKLAQAFKRWPWGHATYRVRIDYTHNGTIPGGYYALADGAKAYDTNGELIAQATPLRVVEEDEFVLEVEEVHYLGAQGAESYRGILRFLTNSGHLVGEIPKSGTKQRVVFADWP